jgi:shikimate dehydrogenase
MFTHALFGTNISQSLSPQIYAQLALDHNIKFNYGLYELSSTDAENFKEALTAFRIQGGLGANITSPFKQIAFELCEHTTVAAKTSQAVNTIWWDKNNGLLYGDNTDGIGFIQDCLDQNIPLANKNILILGAGGAAAGLVYSLLQQQPKLLAIYNRTYSRARALVSQFPNKNLQFISDLVIQAEYYSYEIKPQMDASFRWHDKMGELNSPCVMPAEAGIHHDQISVWDLIINATSSSHQKQLPKGLNNNIYCNYAYDLGYFYPANPFLIWATKQGALKCVDGKGMLKQQAHAAFEHFLKA